jgi:hypothetical protein
MAAIESEIDLVRTGSRKNVIRVDVSVTFAAHWLIPRLGTLAEEHPDIHVDVITVDGPIDLTRPTYVAASPPCADQASEPARVDLRQSTQVGAD